MELRRLGRLEHLSSVVMYGGAALGDVSQAVADASIEQALVAGINHFDMAATYGDAELRLGPWSGQLGPDAFLATKTGERDRDAAWAQINQSLERLRVDRVDLIQLHAIGTTVELDLAMRTGGAIEAVIRAHEEGLAGAIGITGHGHEAPATHLQALSRFPFDTVLTPYNFVLSRRPDFHADFLALVQAAQTQDVGLMTIKAVARRNWQEGDQHRYATWYEPWDDQPHIDASVAFALRQPGVACLAAAGDVQLLPRVVAAAERADALTDAAISDLLSGAAEYESPFESMPA